MTIEDALAAPCPSDEQLGALIEGRLSGADHAAVAAHVARCDACSDVVAAALPPTVPAVGLREGAAARDGRRRTSRSWRRFAWAATLAITIGGLALAAARGSFPGLGIMVGQALGRRLGGDARVAGVRMQLGPSGTFVIGLRELHYRHGQDLFSADDIEATGSLASLVSRGSLLRRLVLVRPRIEAATPGGVGMVMSRELRGRMLAALDTIERIDVVDGTLLLRDAIPASGAITGITGGVELASGRAQIVLHGRLAGGTLDVTGSLGADDAALALTLAGRDVATSGIALLHGHVDGRAEWHLDVTSNSDGTEFEGRLAIRDGRWLGAGLSRTLDIDATVRVPLFALEPRLEGADLPFDELRAAFIWRRGAWDLPRAFARTGEFVAVGAASIRADGTVEGRGTVRLPSALRRALASHAAAPTALLGTSEPAIVPFVVRGSLAAPRFTRDLP